MNKPEKKFRAGSVSATIWNNEQKGPNGPYSYHTVSVERNYKDKEGNWKSAGSFRINDLPKATLVLSKAYEYLATMEKSPDTSADDDMAIEEIY